MSDNKTNERLAAALDQENYDKIKAECLKNADNSKSREDDRLEEMLNIVDSYGSFKLNEEFINTLDKDRLEYTLTKINEYHKIVRTLEDIRKKK